MKRILVATDFSPTAEKAFRFALDIATKAKGAIILNHNFTPAESTFVAAEQTRKRYNTQAESDSLKRLQRLKKKVAEDSGVAVSTIVGRSPLITNLLGFAEHNHIDLIVMGTQGATGLKKTIIGSVAARVIEKADVPVLLVPAKYKLEEPKQFVFATNYQPSDKQALKLVNALAKLYHAEVTVLHFLSVYETETEKERKRREFDSYAFSLQRYFNESRMKFHLLETSSITETMENLDKKFPYDLLVMVRRQKTLLEKFFVKSFTKNMAYITDKPLLIVPEIG